MQKFVNIYIVVSVIAFIITSFQNYEQFENYFASALAYYSNLNTNMIFYNFCLSIIILIHKSVVSLVFVQMKEIQKMKIIQKLKYRILDILFIIFMDIDNFQFYQFLIIIGVVLSFIIHNLAIIRSEYLINTHNITLKQHYKLLAFYILLLFVDYSILKNTLLWHIHHQGTSLVFLYYILYIMLAAIEPFIVFLIHVYERFSLHQFQNLNYHLAIINLAVNLPRFTILIILGLCIAFQYVFTIWFLLSLIQTIIDMIQMIKGFRNLTLLNKTIQQLPQANKQLLQSEDDLCMVCFREMQEGRVLPCKHIFHSECLRQWIQKNTNHFCPKCKRPFDFGIQKPKNELMNIVNNNNNMNNINPNNNNLNNQNNLNNNQVNDQVNPNNAFDPDHNNLANRQLNPNNENKQQLNQNEPLNNFQKIKLFHEDLQDHNFPLNLRSSKSKYIGSLAFCLPAEASYHRKFQDFKDRMLIKRFNTRINETLSFSPKLQMVILDED